MHQDVPVPGITMVNTENFAQWQMDIEVLDQNPIYHGKIFRLNFKFTENYPIEAPEVMFVRAIDRGTFWIPESTSQAKLTRLQKSPCTLTFTPMASSA